MLEKLDTDKALIVAALRNAFELNADQVAFLQLGADWHAAVFKAIAIDGTAYFVKLLRGPIDEIAVTIPSYLRAQGIAAVLAPIPTTGGQLWADLGDLKLVLYPFVEGHNGVDAALSGRQWRELGAALQAIHATRLPPDLSSGLPRETYSPRWRRAMTSFLAQSGSIAFDDPLAAELAKVLKARRVQIEQTIERSARLAAALRRRPRPLVLCHTDLHGWNVLLGAGDALFIVDWDTPLLAPKERDLMFTCGEIAGIWYRAADEVSFWQGYGQAEIDEHALSYYRFERVVEDIAVSCALVFSTKEKDLAKTHDREQAVRIVINSVLPDHVVERVHRTNG